MKLWSDAFKDGAVIPARYAFCAPDQQTLVRLSGNVSPHLAWNEVPNGTQSFALMVYDCDAPLDRSDVNQTGKTLAPGIARQAFFHWLMVDIPAACRSLGEGEYSNGVLAGGKPPDRGDGVLRPLQGVNDYSNWFADDAAMAGQYYGYDGPCPPWNDMLMHHYIFRLYALDVPTLGIARGYTGIQFKQAIFGHILDEAQIIASYTLNPAL
jgi:Raf kinase inhibitor-like YbhB/YbcL family protein